MGFALEIISDWLSSNREKVSLSQGCCSQLLGKKHGDGSEICQPYHKLAATKAEAANTIFMCLKTSAIHHVLGMLLQFYVQFWR